MNLIEGNLYDGKSSASYPVRFCVTDDGTLFVEGYELTGVSIAQVSISSRVGNSARYIDLENGVRIETEDNDAVDAILKSWRSENSGILHALEKNLSAAVLSLLLVIAFLVVLSVYGIPALSGPIVRALPTSLDDMLGAEVLDQLDSMVFEPSSLDSTTMGELQELFEGLLPESERDFDLQFRSSELFGANAFALPNGQIVITDQLVELSEHNEMLASILLHEIGHVVERHTMQAVVRRAGFSMLLFGVTGDVGSAATTLVVLLPSFLIESSYTRDLEWDADTYALDQMKLRNLDTNAFADVMELMLESAESEDGSEAEPDESTGEADNPLLKYFGSHPPSRDRMERFRQAAEN